jgi:DNA-binding transcriptional MerR regulator
VSDEAYKLDELAKAAGTSARTVRYYVQRGLLPPPVFKGKDSAYGRDHLVRLQAIKKLQGDYLPLDAIAAELEGKSIEEIESIAKSSPRPVPSPDVDVRPRQIVVVTPLVRADSWRRHEIARGLEIHLADDASAETKALAEKILKAITKAQRSCADPE